MNMSIWTWVAVVLILISVVMNVFGINTKASQNSRMLWAVLGMLALAIIFALNH